MKQKSFTLIELLVVIVIIGILASVIIVSVSSSIETAKFAKAQAFSSNVSNKLWKNIISEWTFKSPAVNNVTEDMEGGNNGTINGATYVMSSSKQCVEGGCYSFDGIDDYIEVPPSTILNQNYEKLTISAWINFTGTQPGTDGYGYIVQKNNSQYEGSAPFVLFVAGAKAVWQFHNGTIKTSIISDLDYNDGNWHYLVGTYNGQNIILYVDSVNVNSAAATSFVNNNSGYLSIGGTRYLPVYRPFKGLIDDVRIYDSALSTSQIKQQYIAGLDSLLSKKIISKEDYNEKINQLAQQ